MKAFGLFLILVLLHQAHSKDFTHYIQGTGSTREEAIHNALMNGINEYYGVTIGSKVTFNSGMIVENKTIIVHESKGIKYKVTNVEFTDKYKNIFRAYLKITFQKFTPSEGLWRSAIVPGWGQYYKGSKLKGTIGLAGTSSLMVAGFLSANHSNDMNEKSKSSYSNFNRSYYHDEATKYHQLSTVFYGVAAGLYALNLFDAVASPVGHTSLGTNLYGKINLQIQPVFSNNLVGCQLSIQLQ
jgi:hypothetical protein